MASMNPLNVYAGPNSLKDYFNPDLQPPLPLVEVPSSLNPFLEDGVRIYAKMMTVLPANNVKALPAMNLLSHSVRPETQTVIEYSSGSTVISMSMVARIFHGIEDTRAFLSNKTSEVKLKLMQFFGLNITLFGGPSQPEPTDERGGIQAAHARALTDNTVVNPNQYENEANWKAHLKWTGPQILRQLPQINVLCAGMGTSGTMTGLGSFFSKAKPSVVKIGVCTTAGDRVPGPRSFALMSPVTFPWRPAVDVLEEVGSADSYTLSMTLSREGLVCGPSSGFNLKGLYQFLARRKAEGTLPELAGIDGEVHCVFLCCDLPYHYINDYFTKVDESHFHPINNYELASVDLYRYDEAWELDAEEALARYYNLPLTENMTDGLFLQHDPTDIILDLRTHEDFNEWRLPYSRNIPMRTLTAHTLDPFLDSATLKEQWLELEAYFERQVSQCSISGVSTLRDRSVLMICYSGNSARVATSVLRAKGVEAYSIRGGARALTNCSYKLQVFDMSSKTELKAEKADSVVSVVEMGEVTG